jgi:hypothetical protein
MFELSCVTVPISFIELLHICIFPISCQIHRHSAYNAETLSRMDNELSTVAWLVKVGHEKYARKFIPRLNGNHCRSELCQPLFQYFLVVWTFPPCPWRAPFNAVVNLNGVCICVNKHVRLQTFTSWKTSCAYCAYQAPWPLRNVWCPITHAGHKYYANPKTFKLPIGVSRNRAVGYASCFSCFVEDIPCICVSHGAF